MGFAENLREELRFQDVQIKELSARTGISKNTIDKYLSERKVQPGVENAVKIARSLGVSVEYLVEGRDSCPQPSDDGRAVICQYQSLNEFNRRTVSDLIKSLSSRQ